MIVDMKMAEIFAVSPYIKKKILVILILLKAIIVLNLKQYSSVYLFINCISLYAVPFTYTYLINI